MLWARPVRVLFASFDEVPSLKGASSHILATCRGVLGEHELHLVTLGDLALPAAPRFDHLPQPLPEPNYLRRGLAFRERVARALDRLRPELVHFRGPWEGLAAVRRGLPCVYEVNGVPSVELPHLYPGATPHGLATLRGWEAECLAGARAVICPSERTRAFLVQTYGASLSAKISVIPNGYDPVPPAGRPPPAAGAPLRLVYLGTLHPWQGVTWSLRGLAALRGRCMLDLYAPSQRAFGERVERCIRKYGLADFVRLRPPQHRGRLLEILPTYHAGLAPLLRDVRNTVQGCLPLKLLDYLAHGLPVIASDLFVVRQIVRHEENGLLHRPGDREAFAGSIARLAGDAALRARLARQARRSLAALPTWDDYGITLRALYRRITARGAPADPRGTPPARAPPGGALRRFAAP
jgi:glycosyltransferase involved in cell wall biosynthesis